MTENSRHRVAFIFGAGASWDFGAPLMCEFLSKAHELPSDLRTQRALTEVEAWREDAINRRALREYKDRETPRHAPDADNLEDMMCLLEIESQFLDAAHERVVDELTFLVAECYFRATQAALDATLGEFESRRAPSRAYGKLIGALRALRDGALWNDRCSFITFNYDVTLDAVLAFTPAHSFDALPGKDGFKETDAHRISIAEAATWPLYWLGRATDAELACFVPRLLKLHGSLNWGTCVDSRCDAPIRQFDFFKNWGTIGLYAVNPVSKMDGEECGYHLARAGVGKGHKPYIIPPSWKRDSLRYALTRVWTRACQDLCEASRVVIVGHSLPPTDSYFRFVLASALTYGDSKRVLVVSKKGDGLNRYQQFLEAVVPGSWESYPHPFADSIDRITKFVSDVV